MTDHPTPARGRLIVATAGLEDPNFDGTVVLLLDHDDDGSLGIVLNRPSPLPVDEVMSTAPTTSHGTWNGLVDTPAVVFVGGPVRPDTVIALARIPHVADHDRWEPVVGDVGVVKLDDGPLPAIGDLASLRVYAGYAGWGPGQLDEEVAHGSWFVVDSAPDDGFSTDPGLLWRSVLRRQGGLFTTVTDDPARN